MPSYAPLSAVPKRSWFRILVLTAIHFLVIGAMAICGWHLGTVLIDIIMQPIASGDIMAEWWQLFQKFAATVTGGLFIGIVVAYVLLIWP